MISSFLSKLLTARQANFTEEKIEIFDMSYSMQPIESLVDLQKNLKDPEIMKEFGKSISDSIVEHFRKKFSIEEKKVANIWTNIFNIIGFGKLNIVNMDDKAGIFEISNNNFAKVYLSKHGVQKKPVCYLISGMIESIFEATTGKKVTCTETSCIANEKKSCVFEIK